MKTESIPRITQEIINSNRIVMCSLDELPNLLKSGTDYIFVDDAHLVSEVSIYQALRLYPKRVILAGTFVSANQQDKVTNGVHLRNLMLNPHHSMFLRLAYSEQALVHSLSSQHRIGGVLKKMNEFVF